MGHLKTLVTQMGYPIGVLIGVVIEINDQTVFQSILASQRCYIQLVYQSAVLYIRRLLANFLRTSIYYFLFIFNQI